MYSTKSFDIFNPTKRVGPPFGKVNFLPLIKMLQSLHYQLHGLLVSKMYSQQLKFAMHIAFYNPLLK